MGRYSLLTLRCRGSGYRDGGAAPRRAEQHILTLGDTGANPVYSCHVPSVRGPASVPPQPRPPPSPSAADLRLAPSYQRSLRINAAASIKTHSTWSACRRGGTQKASVLVQVTLEDRLTWPRCVPALHRLRTGIFQLISMLERKTFPRAKPGLMPGVSSSVPAGNGAPGARVSSRASLHKETPEARTRRRGLVRVDRRWPAGCVKWGKL